MSSAVMTEERVLIGSYPSTRTLANMALEVIATLRTDGDMLWVLQDLITFSCLTSDVDAAMRRKLPQHCAVPNFLETMFHVANVRIRNKQRLLFDTHVRF